MVWKRKTAITQPGGFPHALWALEARGPSFSPSHAGGRCASLNHGFSPAKERHCLKCVGCTYNFAPHKKKPLWGPTWSFFLGGEITRKKCHNFQFIWKPIPKMNMPWFALVFYEKMHCIFVGVESSLSIYPFISLGLGLGLGLGLALSLLFFCCREHTSAYWPPGAGGSLSRSKNQSNSGKNQPFTTPPVGHSRVSCKMPSRKILGRLWRVPSTYPNPRVVSRQKPVSSFRKKGKKNQPRGRDGSLVKPWYGGHQIVESINWLFLLWRWNHVWPGVHCNLFASCYVLQLMMHFPLLGRLTFFIFIFWEKPEG